MRRRRLKKIKVYAVDAAMIFLAFQLTSVLKSEKTVQGYDADTYKINYVSTVTASNSECEQNAEEPLIQSRDWDAEETEILLRIAMAEAEGEGVEGKAHVMGVVLNRVWSKEFPDTIEEVVFQDGQFTPVKIGGRYWTVTPDQECYEAHEMLLRGWDESKGALYFCTDGSSKWIEENTEYLYTVGNHNFYK